MHLEMKNNLILCFLFIISTINLHGQSKIIADELMPGQCVADVESKRYLSDISKSNPIKYSCQYVCLNSHSEKMRITALHNYLKSSASDSLENLVCHGTQIIPEYHENYTSVTVRSQAFWAPLSPAIEIRSWARENKIQIPSEAYNKLRHELNIKLLEIAKSYSLIDDKNFPQFKKAAIIFVELTTETEESEKLFHSYFQKIAKENLQSETPTPIHTEPTTTEEILVLQNLKALAGFFAYLESVN